MQIACKHICMVEILGATVQPSITQYNPNPNPNHRGESNNGSMRKEKENNFCLLLLKFTKVLNIIFDIDHQ